uniref:Uncharacterized protein n=1 Tax=Tanacetum cinerariifolium TaxID=118510 RepID=A0A699HH09_TANCI|nr:hypothetical protein [Tanacetum cinerariifolium]
MAFISSAKNSSGNGEVNTASIPTTSTQVSPTSANVTAASISLDTACALASQSNGSQIKYEDINQINEDDIEEMDIKWNMTLLSMRADRFWKKTGKKISIQGNDVAGFDKSKDWSYMANEEEDHALVADEEAPTEFALIAKSNSENKVKARLVEFKNQEIKFCEKIRCLKFKVESKDNRIERLTKELEELKKEKEGLDSKLTVLFPSLPAQVYSPPKKDMSWTGLPEFADDTITDYSRPSPSIESNSINLQNSDSSISENEESSESIMSKPMIKFVKAADSPTVINTNKDETIKKPSVKYAEMYRKTSKSSNVRGNQRNWNNLKSQQVGENFLMKKRHVTNVVILIIWPMTVGNSKNKIDNKGYWDSGCSRYMTGNISYHSNYEPFDRGYVSFGQGGCKITGKGTIKTGKLEFENVYFVKDLKYNLFSVSQICDNKNSVLFTDSECIVLGRDFKLRDDTNVFLKTPRQHNMYSIDLNNIVPHKDLTCLVAKASTDESELWHRRLGLLGLIFSKLRMRLGILRNFITAIENLKDLKEIDQKEFSNARTPQQNRVAERINRTLIEAAKTMLADAKLPVTFWAEAVNTAWKFDAKGDEGYFIGYSMSSKAFRVFNKRTKRVEENVHNYVPVVSIGTTSTNFSSTKDAASHDVKKDVSFLRYIVLPNWFHEAHLESSTSNAQDACKVDAPESSRNSNPTATSINPPADQIETLTVETPIPTVSSLVPTVCLDDSPQLSSDTRLISKRVTSQDDTPSLDNILTLSNRFEDILGVTTNTGDTNGVEANLSNMENNISASLTSTFRIHKDHLTSRIISSVDTPVQTRNKSKKMEEQGFIASIHHKTNPDFLQFCLFSCFLSQEEPKKIFDALKDPRVRPFGTKWVLKNKKDERGIVIRNKARLVAQGHTHEEGIDYEEVFAPVARIKAIRLFLAYASFMGFTVYQMDAKSVFLYGTIDEEVYVMQPSGFQDPEFPARVYKVEKAMYALHQAPRAWYGTLSKYLLTNGFQRGTIDQTLFIRKHKGDFLLIQVYVDDIIFGSSNPQLCGEYEALMHEKFQMSAMGELNFFLGLQVLQKKDGIFLSQDKYVGDILKKFGYSDVRPDIMFAVCACARHQVTPKECHLHAVKRIFRYLKSHPKLGIWYPKDSYVATASGCGQVLWIQNQLLDYRLAFCDYHNMIAILEKYEHNVDFHPIVDFVEASHIRYALTINPTVYVLHIRQFWSTARVETSDERTKILATVDGRIVPLFETMLVHQGEGSGTPIEPHHTPSPEAPQSPQHDLSSSIHPPVTTATLPTVIPTDIPPPHLGNTLRELGLLSPQLFPLLQMSLANIIKSSTLPHDSTPRVTSLAAAEGNKDGGGDEPSGEDATIKGRSLETGEEAAVEKTNILTSRGVQVVSVPPATVSVPTGSGMVPTTSSILTTTSVVTPYARRKGKEKMVESDTPKKKRLQGMQKIARIHVEEELQMLIDSLDRNNETVTKYLQEYEQFVEDLSIGERIELINDLVKYQDNYAKVLKFQSQQRKPLSKKQQREFYMSFLKSHSGWKTKHFKGMSLEERERKGLRLEQDNAKKVKTSEEVSEEDLKEVSEEDLKTMMQLVRVKEVYVEALQVKHPIIDWEIHTEGQRTYWKIIRLGGNTVVYQFFVDMLKHFDREDLNQLWTLVKETLSIRQATSDKEKKL